MSDSQRRASRLIALALVVASAFTVAPLWVPLVLAFWAADLLHPAVRKLERLFGGRRRGAAAVVALLVTAILVPIAGLVAALAVAVHDMLGQLRGALEGRGTVAGVLLGGEGPAPADPRQWAELASRYGANAWRAVLLVARTSAAALIGSFVFVVVLYALAASGARTYRWLARHSPIAPSSLGRFARAFGETGRGLVIGHGGTALVQGVVATLAYVSIGIPRALLLGPLTAVCALLPTVGTALVWVPLAVELAVTGDYTRAGLVFAVGAGVISVVDNFARPVLTRHGRLNLPTTVVLVSMLGGVATYGAAGVLLGPLIVRLAAEAVAIARDGRVSPSRRSPPGPPPEVRDPRRPHGA